jgi:hypothetical protein
MASGTVKWFNDQIGADQEAYGVMGHLPEAIDHWARALAARFPGKKIAVCLEPSKGSLIYALLKYDCFVLYPIHPRMLAKFREAFAPSGKKDDPADAQLLLELVSTTARLHSHCSIRAIRRLRWARYAM